MPKCRARTFAIGDVHGCLDELKKLLEVINFQAGLDQLIFCGDLVGRGPHDLLTIEFVIALGENSYNVMGNHDLKLLGRAFADNDHHRRSSGGSEHAERWQTALRWLSQSRFIFHDDETGTTIVHAGVPPQLSVDAALELGREIEAAFRTENTRELLGAYVHSPVLDARHVRSRLDRVIFAMTGFTRIKFCGAGGALELQSQGKPGSQPEGLVPWYEMRQPAGHDEMIIFGHWAALGLLMHERAICCDGGCVWGGELIAIDLKRPFEPYRVPSAFNAFQQRPEHFMKPEML